MELLLTVLSVLTVWVLLAVLVIGIHLIRKALESVRIYLEKIAMGVRAIEQQTAATGSRAEKTIASLNQTEEAFSTLSERFLEMDRLMKAAPPVNV